MVAVVLSQRPVVGAAKLRSGMMGADTSGKSGRPGSSVFFQPLSSMVS